MLMQWSIWAGDQEKPAAPTAIDKSEANAESAATKSSNDEQNEVEKMETWFS